MTSGDPTQKLLLIVICFYALSGFSAAYGQQTNEEANIRARRMEVAAPQNDPSFLLSQKEGIASVGTELPVPGKWINPDSVPHPRVVPVGKPKRLPLPSNVRTVKEPRSVPVPAVLPVVVPGKDGVPLPKVRSARGKVVPARQPRPVPASAPEIKENALGDFQIIGVLQGMSSAFANPIVEDRRGNLWFGTGGGGASRYDGHSFIHYSEEEGLLYSSVHSLMEDSRGNIWIGTDSGGATRYDGQNFTHYTETEGMSSNIIDAMMEDSQGNLWFGTEDRGVCKYTPGNQGEGTFTHFTPETGISHPHIRSILEDSRGDLWFATQGGGVTRYDGAGFTHYTTEAGLSHNSVRSIIEDNRGDLWFATMGGGVCRFEPDDKGGYFACYTTEEGLSSNFVEAVYEDGAGNLWFGTQGGGVNKYDRSRQTITHYTMQEGLPVNEVSFITEDSQGNLWFGTSGGGACRYREQSFSYTAYLGMPRLEDRKGNLLAFNDGSLKRFDHNLSTYTEYTPAKPVVKGDASVMLEDSRGNIWMGIGGEGLLKYNGQTLTHYTQKEGLAGQSISSLIEDRQGNIWIGTHYNGVSVFDGTGFFQFGEAEGLAHHHVHPIMEDSKGNIWIGMDEGGVSRYDSLGNHTRFTSENGLTSNEINSMIEDSKGNIWIGTWNGGLNIYDGQTFTVINKRDGLSNDIISSILEDEQGRFWVSTEQGLNLLIPVDRDHSSAESPLSGFQIITLEKNDGVKPLNQGDGFLDSDNRIWWGHAMLDLNRFELPATAPSIQLNHLELEQVFVDFRRLADTAYLNTLAFGDHLSGTFDSVAAFHNYPLSLTLPHQVNHLTFHFSGIDWTAPHKITYQFMLEGLDEDWNPVTSENKADYRSLPPNNYTFKVKAAGQSMLWSAPLKYTFTILPPWWMTWWAKVLYGLAGVMAILVFVRRRTATLKKRQKVLEQTIKDRTAEVVEQKERAERSEKFKEQFLANMSHEIRTPMNAISGMVKILRRNELLPAQRKYLDAIHQSSDNLLVILNDILDLSKIEAGKIEIESLPVDPKRIVENVIDILRFKAEEKGLQLTFHFQGDIPDLVMGDPTRLNQILINLAGNAIKFTEEGAVDLAVSRNEKANKLRFAVKDSGIGIPADKLESIFGSFEQVAGSITRKYGGTGLGLSITKQLVELQKGRTWVESEEGRGSTFFFEIPLIPADGKAGAQKVLTEDQIKAMAASLAGIRILLAEDNEFNVMLAQDDLSYYIPEVQVEVANDGKAAFGKYKSGAYDLILMDVQMPEMSGYDATQKIREWEAARPEKSTVPIIAMTASLLKSEVAQCYEAGMNNYIPKPYKIEELIGTIYEEVSAKHKTE